MNKITKPNRKNTSKKYWEKVLRSHGLGVDQPLTDNSTDPSADLIIGTTGADNPEEKGQDRKILREYVDADDPLIFGHEIKSIRKLERQPPEWALSNQRILEILKRSFPKFETNDKQRARAGRWLRVIYLYYRMCLPQQIVAKELRMSEKTLKSLIQNIHLASQGLRANKTGKRTVLPLVRTSEGIGRKENEETVKGPHLPLSANGSRGKVATSSS